MKRIISNLLVLCVTFLGIGANAVEPITPQKTKEQLDHQKAVVLDVREQDEVAEGMIQGAAWIPKSGIDAGSAEWKKFMGQTDKKKPIILYCRSGGRAGRVAEVLEKQGFKTFNMGGFDSWKEAGFPTKTGP